MAPLWVSKLICKTPISRWVNKLWHGGKEKSTLAIIQELTDNKDLQTVFSYCWGDYGTVPAKSHFGMHSVLLQHYQYGAFYPVGGASEIAYNVIPVIERLESIKYLNFRLSILNDIATLIYQNYLQIPPKCKETSNLM